MNLIETIQRGEGKWGRYHEEYSVATKEAENIILQAKEPLEIRTKLLQALLSAKYYEGGYDEAMNHAEDG